MMTSVLPAGSSGNASDMMLLLEAGRCAKKAELAMLWLVARATTSVNAAVLGSVCARGWRGGRWWRSLQAPSQHVLSVLSQ